MEGGHTIKKSTTPERKADWMRNAMVRMDEALGSDTRHSIREACACCLGGKRQKLSRSIARDHVTIEARVAAANETKFVFGHSVARR